MFAKGQRVQHKQTHETGTIQQYNYTYSPITNESFYHLLVKGDDGRDWFAAGRQVDVVTQEAPDG